MPKVKSVAVKRSTRSRANQPKQTKSTPESVETKVGSQSLETTQVSTLPQPVQPMATQIAPQELEVPNISEVSPGITSTIATLTSNSHNADMEPIMSTRPVVCRKKDELIRQAWKSLESNSVNDIIIRVVEVQMRGMFGYIDPKEPKMKDYREYTPLVIACMFRDLELVKKLIEAGADINFCPQEFKHYSSKKAVPPLYYASAARDADIVKLLLDSGADVNGYTGRRQCINLQEPRNEAYSIIQPNPSLDSDSDTSACMIKILELYLSAGVKLNTTFWGPCLFYGRGKVYRVNRLTRLNVPDPCFTCDTAVLLLQHGVDPDLYKLKDVLQQFSQHSSLYRSMDCVNFNTFLQTFIGAGYHFTSDDTNNEYDRRELKRNGINMEEPLSLKQGCRSMIRKHLRILSEDTSIFPCVDKLPIPLVLKEYLKLLNIFDLNNTLIKCKPRW